MTQKFRNKYRIPSTRLQNWDYGWNAFYFVTICTHKRKCYFGEVVNGNMILSEIGKMAEKCWMEIPNHFPFVKLDAHVVMPNHVHGIIIIDKPDGDGISPRNKFGPQSKNLASIIRGYKIGVTNDARKIHADFSWQPLFHDHIIRDDKSYQNIKNYIIANPSKWNGDKFYDYRNNK